MDDKFETKKTKPTNTIESMFHKKFKQTIHIQAAEMESCSSNSDKGGQLVKTDQLVETDHRLVKTEYDACLAMAVKCLRFCIRQGWELCPSESSWGCQMNNEGIFIGLFKLFAVHDDNFSLAVSENALEHYQITSLQVQKEIVNACARETIKRIVQDIGDDYFGILVDGSYDKLEEDHLSVFLLYVDKKGMVIERFLGIARVEDFTPVSCKAAIDSLLVEHSLSPSKIRGQSYNGASKLAGNIHGLKTLLMKDYHSAYYLHSFSHRLDFTITTAVEESSGCACWLFMKLADLLSLVKVSCARREMLEDVRAQKILKALGACEIESGRYLNSEYCLERTYDSQWEYDYYEALVNVVNMYPMIFEVLDMVTEISSRMEYRSKANTLLEYLESFEFVFVAHLMIDVLRCTHVLNRALQRRDQVDISNIVSLVTTGKELLQRMRSDHEWEKLLHKVISFCAKNDIEVPNMNSDYVAVQIRRWRPCAPITNLYHFQVDVYFGVIDQQIELLNNEFDGVNMELLTCMACLNPKNRFSSFDKQKVIRLAEFYPGEFSTADLMVIGYQLDNFILDMRTDDRFQNVEDLNELAVKLVETRKHDLFVYVYLLLKLTLILPVTTPSIERTFSAMDYVKYKLQNNDGDRLLYDSLTAFVERQVFDEVADDDIVNCFKAMKTSDE